jgi:hypothetical protein
MMQSEFNLIIWFVSYNIFFNKLKQWPLQDSLRACARASVIPDNSAVSVRPRLVLQFSPNFTMQKEDSPSH